ncbi:zinc finger MYM-type protein 1-like [Uloborus diversus]|uniref:zinc finger MYM-type protein 1-like n=1 Tax=Uloborus diversus TaxID=327109 RepID=UPI002409EA6B|nr:zinc finger MYM-type protein 1-like [Uloborus diversus]
MSLVETRWAERHDSVMKFREDFAGIVGALEEISNWQDLSTSTKAKTLTLSLCNTEFIVSLLSLSKVLSLTVALSRYLQQEDLDIATATGAVEDVMEVLTKLRENADEEFSSIFQKVIEICKTIGLEVKIPRFTVKQTQRGNVPAENAEMYYRRNVFLPLLDCICQDIQSRFSAANLEALELKYLLPKHLIKKDVKSSTINNLSSRYWKLAKASSEHEMRRVLAAEVTLWQAKLRRMARNESSTPTVAEAFDECDNSVFPMIKFLYQLLLTLPICVASAERSFSALKRLKTWLRNSMSQERLVGLALLHVHQDIELKAVNVVERFMKTKNRRLQIGE